MVSKFGFPFRYKSNKKMNPLTAVKVTCLIRSGTLISIPKLMGAEGTRSGYFIDNVDTEWRLPMGSIKLCSASRSFILAVHLCLARLCSFILRNLCWDLSLYC